MSDVLQRAEFEVKTFGHPSKESGLNMMAEISRLRTALSEAEQRVKNARREAMEEAAKVAEDEDGHFTLWGQDCNTRVSQKTAADAAIRIRALIPSEPHDAERRE